MLDITISSHASWPYDENWKVWEYIKESIGGTINVNAIPSSDFGTKFTLVMATPDSLPDVFGFMSKPSKLSDYAEQGAFVAFDDYEEFLPDYNEFWNSRPEEEQWMCDTRKGIDGKKQYILPNEGDNAKLLYGFQTIGSYLRIDPAAAEACMSEEQAATTDFVLEHTYAELEPTTYMSLSSSESETIADYNTSLSTFVSENLQKFILGQRPMSEWDKFQEELAALPIAEVLAVYERAYNRIKD